jgi:hypothetical protein
VNRGEISESESDMVMDNGEVEEVEGEGEGGEEFCCFFVMTG